MSAPIIWYEIKMLPLGLQLIGNCKHCPKVTGEVWKLSESRCSLCSILGWGCCRLFGKNWPSLCGYLIEISIDQLMQTLGTKNMRSSGVGATVWVAFWKDCGWEIVREVLIMKLKCLAPKKCGRRKLVPGGWGVAWIVWLVCCLDCQMFAWFSGRGGVYWKNSRI